MTYIDTVNAAISNLGALNLNADFDVELKELDTLEKQLQYFAQFKAAYTELDGMRKAVYAKLAFMDKVAVPKILEDAGHQDGIRVRLDAKRGINFRVSTKYSAKTLDKEKLYVWLRDRGDGDLITETVNAGTLAAYLKGLSTDENIDAPSDAAELTTYSGVGMNTYIPKE